MPVVEQLKHFCGRIRPTIGIVKIFVLVLSNNGLEIDICGLGMRE